jgi:hypothetical protein
MASPPPPADVFGTGAGGGPDADAAVAAVPASLPHADDAAGAAPSGRASGRRRRGNSLSEQDAADVPAPPSSDAGAMTSLSASLGAAAAVAPAAADGRRSSSGARALHRTAVSLAAAAAAVAAAAAGAVPAESSNSSGSARSPYASSSALIPMPMPTHVPGSVPVLAMPPPPFRRTSSDLTAYALPRTRSQSTSPLSASTPPPQQQQQQQQQRTHWPTSRTGTGGAAATLADKTPMETQTLPLTSIEAAPAETTELRRVSASVGHMDRVGVRPAGPRHSGAGTGTTVSPLLASSSSSLAVSTEDLLSPTAARFHRGRRGSEAGLSASPSSPLGLTPPTEPAATHHAEDGALRTRRASFSATTTTTTGAASARRVVPPAPLNMAAATQAGHLQLARHLPLSGARTDETVVLTPPPSGAGAGMGGVRSLSDGNLERYTALVRETNAGLAAAQAACAEHVRTVRACLPSLAPAPDGTTLAAALADVCDATEAAVAPLTVAALKGSDLSALIARVQDLQVHNR